MRLFSIKSISYQVAATGCLDYLKNLSCDFAEKLWHLLAETLYIRAFLPFAAMAFLLTTASEVSARKKIKKILLRPRE
jgi:hypothetical protein